MRSNNYIGGDDFKNLLTTEKVAEWKWAKNSKQAKAYKKLTSEFLDGVKGAQSQENPQGKESTAYIKDTGPV